MIRNSRTVGVTSRIDLIEASSQVTSPRMHRFLKHRCLAPYSSRGLSQPSFCRSEGGWRLPLFYRNHLVDQTTHPHRPGIDIEVVEHVARVLFYRFLLRLEDQLILVEDAVNSFAQLSREGLIGGTIVAHERPVIMASRLRLGSDCVE